VSLVIPADMAQLAGGLGVHGDADLDDEMPF
jgi:hypothetical protein